MRSFKTYLYLFFGMVLYGSATPLSKLVSKDFPVFVAGMARLFLAVLLLLPFIHPASLKAFKGKDMWLLVGIGLVGTLGFTAFMLYGMQMASGVTGSVVMSATPALTAVLSIIFF